MDAEHIDRLLGQLPPLAEEDSYLMPMVKQHIAEQIKAGWSDEDILSYHGVMEHFNSTITEAEALRRMLLLSMKFSMKYGE